LGAAVAKLPWLGDEVTEAEQLLLEELASLTREYPGLSVKAAAFPWMNTLNGVGPQAHQGVAAIRLAATVDMELAEFLSGYRWLPDGITPTEAIALAEIADLASQDPDIAELLASSEGFVSGGTIQHVAKGAGHLSGIYRADPALGRKVAAYPWIADGVTRIEAGALFGIDELLRSPVQANPALAEKLAGHSWIADGITAVEIKALDDFLAFQKVAEQMGSNLPEWLAGYSWVADGITSEELEALRWFEALLSISGPANFAFVDEVAGLPWVADGVTPAEQDHLRIFWRWLEAARGFNTVFLRKAPTYSWVSDGVTTAEWESLSQLYDSAEAAGPRNSALVARLMDYYWVADGLTPLEMSGLRNLWELLESAADSGLNLPRVVSRHWMIGCVPFDLPDGGDGIRELIQTSEPEHSALLGNLLTAPLARGRDCGGGIGNPEASPRSCDLLRFYK